MNHPLPDFHIDPLIQQTIDSFWVTFPPMWHQIRSRIGQEARESFNLTHEQFHVLRRIHLGRTSVSDLAEAKHISRPAASRAVDTLVEKGLVSRTQDSHDRRHVFLSLTVEGEKVMEATFERISTWMAGHLSVLTAEELQQVDEGLKALKKAFQ